MGAMELRKQATQHDYDVGDDDDLYVTKSPSSARRYQQPIQHDTVNDPVLQGGMLIQRRRASVAPNTTANVPSKAVAIPDKSIPLPRISGRRFSVIAILVGMLVMAFLAIALSALGSWWQVHMDDMQYGRPRTFQLDAVVGHADSAANPSHFIFINLNRHIEIIELPGGDATHAHIYLGPVLFGEGQDLTPVTADIRDVNGDGKPDLVVHILNQQLVFINDGSQFRPLQTGEHVNL